MTGAGLTSITAQNGIQVSFGADGTIDGNTVTGLGYGPSSFSATGILVWEADGVTVSNNIVTMAGNSDDGGIAFIDSDSPTATGNNVTSTYAIYHLGSFTTPLAHGSNLFNSSTVAIGFYPGDSNAYDFTGSQGDDDLEGVGGNDTLFGADGNDYVLGDYFSSSNDSLFGGNGDDIVVGQDGFDQIHGDGDVDTLDYSYATQVSIDATGGTASVSATDQDQFDGFEVYVGTSGNDTIHGTGGTVFGGGGADFIDPILAYGGSGDDTIVGEVGENNTFFGDAGDDSLVGGDGFDTLYGGPDDDTALFSGNYSSFFVTNAAGVVTVQGASGTVTAYESETLLFDDGYYDVGTGVFHSDGPPNNAPVAVDDSYTVREGSSIQTDLQITDPHDGVLGIGAFAQDSDPDGDPLQAHLFQSPTHGTLHLNADGTFEYVPFAYYTSYQSNSTPGTWAAGYNPIATPDVFKYRAFDGTAYSNEATVSITVTPPELVSVSIDGYDMTNLYRDLSANAVYSAGITPAFGPAIPGTDGFTVTTDYATYEVRGTGFTYDGLGVPDGGVIDGSITILGAGVNPKLEMLNYGVGSPVPNWTILATDFVDLVRQYNLSGGLTSELFDTHFVNQRYSIVDAAPAVSGVLVGGNFDDYFAGAAGSDTMFGGAGNDFLIGGADGGDVNYGGSGSDLFQFGGADGNDRIGDFSGIVGGENDIIDLRAVIGGANNFSQVMNHTSQVGVDAVIDYASFDVTLSGVDRNDLREEDFLYATTPVQHNSDTMLDSAAQDPLNPGDLYAGSGIPASDFAVARDDNNDIELGLQVIYRQGPSVNPYQTDVDGTAHFDVAEGTQSTDNGSSASNPAYAAWSFQYSINTALNGNPQTLGDYEWHLKIDTDSSAAVSYADLMFAAQAGAPGGDPGNWQAVSGLPVPPGTNLIVDDEGTTQVTQNSQNYAFYTPVVDGGTYAFGPGTFDIALQAVDATSHALMFEQHIVVHVNPGIFAG